MAGHERVENWGSHITQNNDKCCFNPLNAELFTRNKSSSMFVCHIVSVTCWYILLVLSMYYFVDFIPLLDFLTLLCQAPGSVLAHTDCSVALWDIHGNLSLDSIWKCHLTNIGNPIVEIRRSWNRLISTLEFPILIGCDLYIELVSLDKWGWIYRCNWRYQVCIVVSRCLSLVIWIKKVRSLSTHLRLAFMHGYLIFWLVVVTQKLWVGNRIVAQVWLPYYWIV